MPTTVHSMLVNGTSPNSFPNYSDQLAMSQLTPGRTSRDASPAARSASSGNRSRRDSSNASTLGDNGAATHYAQDEKMRTRSRSPRNPNINSTPRGSIDLLLGSENAQQRARLAVPERDIEDVEAEADNAYFPVPQAGVDDGFLEKPDIESAERGDIPREWRPFPVPNDNNNPPLSPADRVDVNVYQHKKTLAQGMMDLALLSANANQLRYVLDSSVRHPYYYFSVAFISASIILQIAVGIGLIWNSRYNVKNKEQICKANKINNFTIIGIFLITIVNVMISAFGVVTSPT